MHRFPKKPFTATFLIVRRLFSTCRDHFVDQKPVSEPLHIETLRNTSGCSCNINNQTHYPQNTIDREG